MTLARLTFPALDAAAGDLAGAPRPARTQHVVAMVNGPGEIAAWLYPFAAALRERDPSTHLSAGLLPCVFASGAEPGVLARMGDVDTVIPVHETMRWIVRGERPTGLHHEKGLPGCVLHMGGELWLSAVLAKRLRYPLVVYAEDRVRYASLADRICLADTSALPAKEAQQRTSSVVGNLMVDAARMRVPHRAARDGATRVVALFPGSRAYQVRNMLPFLMKVAGNVAGSHTPTRWIVAQSEFVSDRQLAAFADGEPTRVLEGERARLLTAAGGTHKILVSERGVRFEVRSAGEAMREADLALTIPGTNTAELAALGIPMMLLFPTHHLRDIRLPGLVGLLRNVPILGPRLTQAVAESYLRTRRFWAHPNRRANDAVVPEVIGRFTAGQIAERVSALLDTSLAATAQRLRSTMGPPGGAARLVDEVMDLIATSGRRW
ncbi:MAG: hypothetical protein ABI877_07155 [Gemmatimonadaceae bacterium]